MALKEIPVAALLQLAVLEGKEALQAFARAHSGETVSDFIVPSQGRDFWEAEGQEIIQASNIKLSPG